jgi:hypothetical protein
VGADDVLYELRIMKKWLLLGLVLSQVACSKMDNFSAKQGQYRQECFGSNTVSCRSMLVDLNIAKVEALMEVIKRDEAKIAACRGQQYFDDGMRSIASKIDYFKELRPNWFYRIFRSDAEVEFSLPPFDGEAAAIAFLANAHKCNQPNTVSSSATQAAAVAASTAAASEAPVVNSTIDSNANGLPTSLDTVAGKLSIERDDSGASYVALNGKRLFQGEDARWQFPIRSFLLSGDRAAILMASSGGRGNSCETLFFFLLADRNGVSPTPQFGSCSPRGTVIQAGDKISLTLPSQGGNIVASYDGHSVLENDRPVLLTDGNDPAK